MQELKAEEGEIRMVIQVKRAATGQVETFDLIGKVNHEEAEALGLTQPKEQE